MDQKVLNNEDLERLRSFLKQNSLPYEDIRLEGNDFFLYLDGEEVVGCGGLEYYGDHGLLRSVAVAKELRGEGFGKKIVEELISRAKDRPVSTVSLLTETAPAFFGKLGFKKQSREDAQKEIKSSSEFSSVCPVSAVLMVMEF